jgi:hypothetical protein
MKENQIIQHCRELYGDCVLTLLIRKDNIIAIKTERVDPVDGEE